MQTNLGILFFFLGSLLSTVHSAEAAKKQGDGCSTVIAIRALLNVDPSGAAVGAYLKGLFQQGHEPTDEQWTALESLASARLPDAAIIGFWQMVDRLPRCARKERLIDRMPLLQVRNPAPETPRAKPVQASGRGVGFHGRRPHRSLEVPRLPVGPPIQRNIERSRQRARARSLRFNYPRRNQDGQLE